MKYKLIAMPLVTLALVTLAMSNLAEAEIVVSANDGKQVKPNDVVPGPQPDSVSVLDLSHGKLKLLGSVAVPATMTGPPAALAVSKDSKFAIVTSAQKLDGHDLVLDDVVSVVDLSVPTQPRVLQTLHAGPGASGVSISPNGKLVLVASTGDDSITVFALAGRKLTFVNKVQLEPKCGPTDVVFSRDGKAAFAIGRYNSKEMVLSVDGTHVTNTGKSFSSGRQPYGAVTTLDGKYLINTNLQGALLAPGEAPPARGSPARPGTVGMVNLSTGAVVASVPVGATPEHVVMSGDGRLIAITVQNGTTNLTRASANFSTVLGLLEVFRVGDGTLTPVARADTGHWCQGSTFSKDDKIILLQCAYEREIEVFRLEGASLSRVVNETVPIGGRPGDLATALSR